MEKDVALKKVEEGVVPREETVPVARDDKQEAASEEEHTSWWSRPRNQFVVVTLLVLLLAAAISLGVLYGKEKSSSHDSDTKTITVTSFLNECSELESQALPLKRAHGNTRSDGQVYNFPKCEDSTGNPNYHGLLYKWTGTGRFTTADMCDARTSFDTYMSVYRCNDNGLLSCIAANNDMGEELCPDGATSSQVQWAAEQDVDYYILVHGNGEGEMGGHFEVYVREGEEATAPPAVTCSEFKSNALPFFGGEGNTITAPVYDYLPACRDDGIPNYQGVLYFWTGRGRWMYANTCRGYRQFDTYLSVYQCNESDELSCVTANNDDDGCGSGASKVAWPAESNVDYFILLHGNGNVAMGPFDLEVYEGEEIPTTSTATCGNHELDVYPFEEYHSTKLGDTKNALVYDVFAECQNGDGDPNYQGNIYYWQGTGRWVTAETSCYSPTDFDTYLSVYECDTSGELSCVTANDNHDGCSRNASRVTWPAEDGRNYFVLVHGSGEDATGVYGIDFSLGREIPLASTVTCGSRALEVFELERWNEFIGDTSDAAVQQLPTCENGGNPNYQGILYHWQGTGRWTDVETPCYGSTDYDTYLSVYECGEGGELSCVAANDDGDDYCEEGASKVTWPAEDSQDYFILVHGNGSGNDASGRFEIRLNEGREMPDALTVTCGTRALEVFELKSWDSFLGDTSDAAVHDVPVCEDGGNPNYQGILYYWEGTGRWADVEISCYHPTDFDTYLSVYECGEGGKLSCVAANDNGDNYCGDLRASKVKWPAEDSHEYFILIHGKGSGNDATGRFEIRLNEEDTIPTPVDPCGNVTAQAINFGSTSGDTSNAPVYNIPACEDDGDPNYQGILYGIVGSEDAWVTASTCDRSTDFDTYISIYTCGADGVLSCVTANNDLNRICHYGQQKSEVVWEAQNGVAYYILVHGNNGETGQFGMNVNSHHNW